jgi:hypothetical protein
VRVGATAVAATVFFTGGGVVAAALAVVEKLEIDRRWLEAATKGAEGTVPHETCLTRVVARRLENMV